jgi:hypothetical protein
MRTIFFDIDNVIDQVDDAGKGAKEEKGGRRLAKVNIHLCRKGFPILSDGKHKWNVNEQVLDPLSWPHCFQQIVKHIPPKT